MNIQNKDVHHESPNIDDYELRTFSYDLLYELINPEEYPEELERLPFLQIITAHKSRYPKTFQEHNKDGQLVELPHPNRFDDIPRKYFKLFHRYYNPRSKHIILDIIFSKVPVEIAVEESGLGEAAEAEFQDYFTVKTLKKYRIKTEHLYEIYFFDYPLLSCFPCDAGEYMRIFFNLIFSKVVTLQPSVFIPDYELLEFCYDPEWFLDNESSSYREGNIDYIKKLNHIRRNIGDCKDAYSQFLTDSYLSIKKKLLKDKLISECPNCGDLFLYLQSKIYCSHKCRKETENKRYYNKHQKKLKELKREDMQITRGLYKKMGVKK